MSLFYSIFSRTPYLECAALCHTHIMIFDLLLTKCEIAVGGGGGGGDSRRFWLAQHCKLSENDSVIGHNWFQRTDKKQLAQFRCEHGIIWGKFNSNYFVNANLLAWNAETKTKTNYYRLFQSQRLRFFLLSLCFCNRKIKIVFCDNGCKNSHRMDKVLVRVCVLFT